MKTYRVSLLGCRSRGTATARVYHAHPRTQVVGLCDLIEDRLNKLGDELGIAARFDDLDEMIRQTEPDIVAIPTAPSLHARWPCACSITASTSKWKNPWGWTCSKRMPSWTKPRKKACRSPSITSGA